PDAPAVLHIAGDSGGVPGATQPAVAVVGARRATAYGLEVARALGRGLAAAGVPVISGLALGIDSAAHAGALEAGGPTIAVLAAGANALLRDGAALVRDAQDVLDALLGAGARLVPAGPDPAALSDPLRGLLDRLGARPATSAALLRPDEDVDAVMAGLVELEL